MAENKWTEEQLEAINEENCNLLVAAAAGAGKTAVLVERIIRKITCPENPVDIDSLLVVTFTNAAATEMKERIADAIAKALDRNPDSKLLQRQISLLNRANITTIHSFCLEVIRNNFHRIGLNPGFRVADETEALLMKMETIDELFEDIYEKEDIGSEFFELLESYGDNKDDQSLKDVVLSLYEFVQSYPWPEDWLREKTEYFNLSGEDDFARTVWGRMLLKNAAVELEGLKSMMEKAVSVIENTEGLSPYLEKFKEEKEKIDSLINACKYRDISWDQIYNAFSSFEFGRLPACRKCEKKESQEYVKSARDYVKGRIRKLQGDIFTFPSERIIEDLNQIYPLLKYLSELVMEFDRRYSEKKRDKLLLDFNDLEHFCLDILTDKKENGEFLPSDIATEYKDRFTEILVDEYQDSNLVQEIILNAISRNDRGTPNIFMVGDVKQSIYRFRQAKPELFLDKYNTYSKDKKGKYRKIQLYKNFRSRKGVIDTVNLIFGRIMSEEAGELDYTDEEALNPGAVFDEDTGDVICTELHIIETKGKRQEEGDGQRDGAEEKYDDGDITENENEEAGNEMAEILDDIQCEARLVANRIKELVDGKGSGLKIYDKEKKEYRPVEYRDIVILMRATRNWADVFVQELSSRGIPVYADTGTGFFKTIEVQIVLSLLQVIDNPLQDIPLLSVLRSPIGSFTAGELADIRLADKESPLYYALKKVAGAGEAAGESEADIPGQADKTGQADKSKQVDESKQADKSGLAEKAARFLKRLENWRNKALYLSTDELIWYLYTETGFLSFVGAMPGGEQRQANLRMLFEQARKFEETSYRGLFNFINFINKLKSSRGDTGSAKILGENENVVRIMSIHKSKGLEFPVVFISGCGKGFNLQDTKSRIIFHQELGFGPDYVDYEKRITYPTLAKQALKYKIRNESLSEEMRILYVGFTRAREKLILTGSVKDMDKADTRWGNLSMHSDGNGKIPSYIILNGGNYLDWIVPAIMLDFQGNHSFVQNHGELGRDLNWAIRIWKKEDVLNDEQVIEDSQQELLSKIREIIENARNISNESDKRSSYYDEINRRLGWKYEYAKSTQIPVKISVTELKRRFAFETADEYPAYSVYMPAPVKKPMFMEEAGKFSAAEIGTILHFVMQHLDLRRVATRDDIKTQVDEMVEKALLTEKQAETVDIDKICGFLTSFLGERMLRAGRVYREVPFNMEIDSDELGFEACKGETVLLQGIIDCYFEEEDGIVLLDYKTDHVNTLNNEKEEESMLGIKERYRMQIEYYARVLEKLTGKNVKEKYIYLFSNGKVIKY